MAASTVETGDIQGILASGYSNRLPNATYVLLEITQPTAARAWLAALAVTNADEARQSALPSAVQIAFTRPGLETLGLGADAIRSFTREFQEGMATPHRGRILGDENDLAHAHWEWGGDDAPRLHVLLMLFAGPEIEALYARQREAWSGGCRELRRLDSVSLPGNKEHFGFHDGIAQPRVQGLSEDAPGEDPTKAGEFVLGYVNEYGLYPDSPTVASVTPGATLLSEGRGPGTKDLGRNGSYLVFRQLEQDVFGFWSFLRGRAGGRMDEATWLGAKMVGRWPNGAPVALYPDKPPPDPHTPTNDFLYLDSERPGGSDPYGQRCPIGSHIRRTNPRDSLEPGPAESQIVTRRHRILRRGRAYGTPLAKSMRPEDFLAAGDDERKRGLHFICLNADIARQFEFIQQTWIVNPKFQGLCGDPDPVIAPHVDPALASSRPEELSDFTIPQDPVRRRETKLRRFVRIRGGAYFFVPSLRALRFLASSHRRD